MSTPVETMPSPADSAAVLQSILTPLTQQAVQAAEARASQIATQAAGQVVQSATDALRVDMASLQSDFAANKTAVEAQLAKAGTKLLSNVEDDPVTQRIVVCSIVAAVLLAGIIILVGAMLGNTTANRWIAGAPIAIGGAVLWVSKVGISLPKPSSTAKA